MLPQESQTAEYERMPEVPVNGKVLQWARELRALSLDDAASRLGISPQELREYEAGDKRPLVGLLRTMSAQYQINFTSLLMPAPLPAPDRPADHRERTWSTPLSIDTLIAMEEINEAIDAFIDIASGADKVVPSPNIGSAQLTENAEAVAARERLRFRISMEEQQSWRGTTEARRKWRQRLEDLGIFTYMVPMPPQELSGFSIFRDGVAAICVNDREPTEGAKIFTLLHEYCHLLLRKTGISDENNSNRIERFCNEFAASFLIPRQALRREIGAVQLPYEFSDSEVKHLSGRFRVSNRAIAMRLQETGFAPDGFYARRTGPWDIPTPVPPLKPGEQIDPKTMLIKRKGKLHARTVLRAAKKKLIDSFDASELLGLRPQFFDKLAARIT
jgi:Zn-dependent peptidase ImmA (M78 family)